MAAEALEFRVARLEKRVRETTVLLEKTTVLLERLVGEADPEYAERQEANRAWAAFIDEHRLKAWRTPTGDIGVYSCDLDFWRDEDQLLEGLRRALRANPAGATARDVMASFWGPEAETADGQDAASVGSALYALSLRGTVVRIPGKPCRWTLGDERRSDDR
jgi:hypothetical protein